MQRILIVEDELQIGLNLQEILELGGYEALLAQDGEKGLIIAQQEFPDLIISDVMMPKLDGYGLLQKLRESPDLATIPVILLTAKADRSDLREGMVLGADDYLTKPFTPHEVLAAIRTQLTKQSQQEKVQQDRMDQLRKNLSYSLPHELNTPLNSILNFTSLLLDHPDSWDPEEQQEMLRMVYDSAQRLYRCTQNFLFYADLELKSNHPETKTQWNQQAFAYPVLALMGVAEIQADKYNRREDLQIHMADVCVFAPQLYVQKITEELVDNACKFSEPGTPVEFYGVATGSNFVLTVSDRGRGMTPGQIHQVGAYIQFDRRLHEQQGNGLGLAIVQRIIHLLGGTITITSSLSPTPTEAHGKDSGSSAQSHSQQTIVIVCLPLANNLDGELA